MTKARDFFPGLFLARPPWVPISKLYTSVIIAAPASELAF
jgi:hypothetical protein